MGTRERRERSDSADKELQKLFLDALHSFQIDEESVSLAAVGGFGRGELSPGSDLDITFVHDGALNDEKKAQLVNAVLYPLWDKGWLVDHSIRSRSENREAMSADIKVQLGLLDLRVIAGQEDLVNVVAADARENWRKNSKKNLEALRQTIVDREAIAGELAYLLEPDLKEARGGLRDIQAIRAIAINEIVPVSLDRLATAEALLANVRDALHEVSGRKRDQLLFVEQDKVAAFMGFADADVLMQEVAKSARTVDYIMSLTWHRLDHSPKRGLFTREKKGEVLSRGVEIVDGEVKIRSDAEWSDPTLGLRAAAQAAQRGLPLSVESATELAERFTPFEGTWPRRSREDLVALIGAGSSMVRVFEALDQEGIIERWLPEWNHVRFLPQRNVLHRHTVDRHMLEVAVKATALTRKVHRPDLLLVAALFHDIGKGYPGKDHSDYGEELIAPLARRIGFPEEDIKTLQLMIKHHLLLPAIATKRELDDPATIEFILTQIPDAQTLELLHALSIADGEATGKAAWSQWKANLVSDLVTRSLSAMAGIKPARQLEISERQIRLVKSRELHVEVEPRDEGYEIEIVSPDRTGLLSVVAGALAISRLDVRSARTRTIDDVAVMTWLISVDEHASAPSAEQIKTVLQRALDGEIDITNKIDERIRNYRRYPGIPVPPPQVSALNDLATRATVVEVRMHDRPGVLYSISKTISRFGVDIQAAIVATLGAEAFDTLYITDLAGEPISEEQAKALARQIERYLETL